MKHSFRLFVIVIALVTDAGLSLAQWEQTPGPCSEDITAFAVVGGKIFAGTGYSGIFVSTNEGVNWTHLDNELAGVQTTCFATIDSVSFVGTEGAGVFLSIDEGQSGVPVDSGLTNSFITSLAVSGKTLFANTWSGLFATTDNGTTWKRISQLDSLNELSGGPLLVKQHKDGSASIYVGDYTGLYRSTDGGIGWLKLNNPPTMSTNNPYITALAVDTSTTFGAYLYAGTWGDGVFRTSDDGGSWSTCNAGLEQNWYDQVFVNALVVSGSSLFLGENIQGSFECGVFLSTDHGTTWISKNQEMRDRNVNALAVKDGILFAGTSDGGVFRSTNDGTNWTQANAGMSYQYVNALAISGANIYAGAGNGGVYLSKDRGTNWSQINNNSVFEMTGYSQLFPITAISLTHNHSIFASTTQGSYRSGDDGGTWSGLQYIKKADGYYSTMLPSCVWSLMNLPRGPDSSFVFAGSLNEGIVVSTNEGDFWSPVNTGLWSDPRNYIVYALLAIPKSTGDTILYAGMGTQSSIPYGSVYRSTDRGSSWTEIGAGLPSADVWSLVYHDPYLYAGTNGYGIYRLLDNSTTWSAANMGLTGQVVASLAVSGNTVFAGTYDRGVYQSSNNGESWSEINDGLGSLTAKTGSMSSEVAKKVVKSSSNPVRASALSSRSKRASVRATDSLDGTLATLSVNALAADSVNLYAGTIGGGVWRRSLSGMTSVPQLANGTPVRFALAQNYPNPFNPTTVIRFELPEVTQVRLTVCDVLGREVQTIVHETKQSGRYEVTFNARNLASGVYFYQLQTGDFVTTKRMMVLK